MLFLPEGLAKGDQDRQDEGRIPEKKATLPCVYCLPTTSRRKPRKTVCVTEGQWERFAPGIEFLGEPDVAHLRQQMMRVKMLHPRRAFSHVACRSRVQLSTLRAVREIPRRHCHSNELTHANDPTQGRAPLLKKGRANKSAASMNHKSQVLDCILGKLLWEEASEMVHMCRRRPSCMLDDMSCSGAFWCRF